MENQQKYTVGLQPTEPNTLYQKPTDHARRMPMEQNKREQFIIRRIGGTTYKVKVVFNESGYETMEDKILRIVRNDMVTKAAMGSRWSIYWYFGQRIHSLAIKCR